MTKVVYIENDGLNGIAICRDNYKGVAVQVVRFVDQLVPSGTDKALVNVKNNQVINTTIVSITAGKDFKDEVGKAITKSKEFLANIRLQDKAIDGVLDTYLSQHKDLNEDVEG